MKIKVGSLIYFIKEKRPYKVRASSDRFTICTKPHFGTVLYTIIDWFQNIRGTENLIFCMGFETDKLCKEALKRLDSGETEVSYRTRIPLDFFKCKENGVIWVLHDIPLMYHEIRSNAINPPPS